jgi:RNA polymerase sigma-70 factor, ECF subfamily
MSSIQVASPIARSSLQGHVEQAEEESDNALAVRGDSESFVLLYHRYSPAVYRYLQARTGSHYDAEELTAQAFERALNGLHRFKPTGTFAGWLFTIVQRVLVDHYRSAGRRQQRTSDAPIEDIEGATQEQPEEYVLRAEQNLILLRAVESLKPEYQNLVYLRFVAQLPYAEIAEIVGKKEAAVKMTTYRALELLKRRIEHE